MVLYKPGVSQEGHCRVTIHSAQGGEPLLQSVQSNGRPPYKNTLTDQPVPEEATRRGAGALPCGQEKTGARGSLADLARRTALLARARI